MARRALAVGDPAPAFSLSDGDGKTRTLAEFRGKRIVLYFYPKDQTPGCTQEACSFRDNRATLTKANAVVLGVSCDSVDSHRRFAEKYTLPFPLLSDPDAAVCKAYGVYIKKSRYGKTYWGIERTTVLINEQGRVAAVFPKVNVDGHTDEVLESLRASTSAPSRAGTSAR